MSRPSSRLWLLFALAVAGALAWLSTLDGVSLKPPRAALRLRQHATAIGWHGNVHAVYVGGKDLAAAGFADPYGLARDDKGVLYVADGGAENRIKKIGGDGVVSVLAGGAEGYADGKEARFNTPSALAVDAGGTVYVADTGNHAIRAIAPDGTVRTLAGGNGPGWRDGAGAQAQFNGPVGLALDRAGNVIVADTYNDRIRRIARDGTVSTIAGGGPGFADGEHAAFDTPCAVALDRSGTIYVADTYNDAVRAIDANGAVRTIARAADDERATLLQRPVSLAVARDGVLYAGELGRGRIVQIDGQGQVHGISGAGISFAIGDSRAPRLTRPTAILLQDDGALLVADAARRALRKVAPEPAPRIAPADAPALGHVPWPLAPQNSAHEVVGVLGEVRGNDRGEQRHHFHNGLDVQGEMGAQVLAVAAEKVASPLPNWGFGELGEGLRVGSMAYIHMRVGRTAKGALLDPARFALIVDDKGKPQRVRVRRGTRFAVGDALGTVNRMFHVHLAWSPDGLDANPQLLGMPGMRDTVAPHIDAISVIDAAGKALPAAQAVARDGGPLAIVAEAWDQNDDNAKRRKLGLYKIGYRLLRADGSVAVDGTPLVFDRLPPDRDSVKVAYAEDSGITVYGNKRTRFRYVLTNTVHGGLAETGSWDPASLPAGAYRLQVEAADFAGNTTRRELALRLR